MTTEFRPEDYSPRQLVTGKELDRIADTSGSELTSEEIGHHAYANINHFINPGIGWLRLAVSEGDSEKAAEELAAINTPALLAIVASKLPGDSAVNIAALSAKLTVHLKPIFDQYCKNALPLIDTDRPFLDWADEVQQYHEDLLSQGTTY
jgi:hypothetical protein